MTDTHTYTTLPNARVHDNCMTILANSEKKASSDRHTQLKTIPRRSYVAASNKSQQQQQQQQQHWSTQHITNSVTRNYCCRAREVTVIYGHDNRSYLLIYCVASLSVFTPFTFCRPILLPPLPYTPFLPISP